MPLVGCPWLSTRLSVRYVVAIPQKNVRCDMSSVICLECGSDRTEEVRDQRDMIVWQCTDCGWVEESEESDVE